MIRQLNLEAILVNPDLKREIIVNAIVFLQHSRGIKTTKQQAENAYDILQSNQRLN